MNNYETAFWIFLVLFIFAIITIGVLAYEYATEKVLVSKAAFIPTYCQVITNHTAVSGGTEGAKTLLNSDNQISSIGVDVKDASYVCFTPIVPSGSQGSFTEPTNACTGGKKISIKPLKSDDKCLAKNHQNDPTYPSFGSCPIVDLNGTTLFNISGNTSITSQFISDTAASLDVCVSAGYYGQ
jgi:hypothetical protein